MESNASCSAEEHDVRIAKRSTMGAHLCCRRRLWEEKVDRRGPRRQRWQRGASRRRGGHGKPERPLRLVSFPYQSVVVANVCRRTGQNQGRQVYLGCQHCQCAVHVVGGPSAQYRCAESPPRYVRPQSVVDPSRTGHLHSVGERVGGSAGGRGVN